MGWLLALFPGRLFGYLAIAGVIFAMGGTAAWKVQQWRITNIKAEHAVALSDAKERVNAAEKANQLKQIGAQNAKTKRQVAIKAATDSTNSSLYGLRDTTNAFAAKDTGTACYARTETLTAVFNQCASALVDLAKKTDGIESDRQLLIDSWPQ